MIVLLKCPKTGLHFSTGIECTPDSFRVLSGRQAAVHCPHCDKDHGWTKNDAVLAAADKCSEIPEVEDCFIRAMDAAEKAAVAKDLSQRDFHSRMERKWMGLAEGYRFIAEMGQRFHR